MKIKKTLWHSSRSFMVVNGFWILDGFFKTLFFKFQKIRLKTKKMLSHLESSEEGTL